MLTRGLSGFGRLLSAGVAIAFLAACGGESPTLPPAPRLWLADFRVTPDPVIKSQPFTVFVLGGAENTVVDSIVISWGEGIIPGVSSPPGRQRVIGPSGTVTIVAPEVLFTLTVVVYGPLAAGPTRTWWKIPR